MKRSRTLGIAVFIAAILALTAYAQKLERPTLEPVLPSAEQKAKINEGVKLHDAKKFDDAIKLYREVLADSPNCTAAMYELALSLNEKGAQLESIETAVKGAKYISDELPLFYVLIANELDDAGKPNEAIKIYKDGINFVSKDKRLTIYGGRLYYNLGITYFRQKQYNDARAALKSAVESDYAYASPHYLLAVIFEGTRYKVPAMLAASRLISVEYNTARSVKAAQIIKGTFVPAEKDPKTGNTVINLDLTAPKDEGDFGMYDLLFSVSNIADEKNEKKKTDNEKFISSLGLAIGILSDDKKLKKTFVGQYYIPFMAEMKRLGHLPAFANIVIYVNDQQNKDAEAWINANETKVRGYMDWAKAYWPPAD